MNRRSILATAAAVATGLVMTMGMAEAQSPADIEGVKAASKAFYAALNTGPEVMLKVYAKTPYVAYVNPAMKTRAVGWDNVKSTVEGSWVAVPTRAVAMTNSSIQVRGSLAWEIGDELGSVKTKDGTQLKIDSAVVNVYEKIDGQWLIVSHHAQLRPQ
jgi:hypothetical protein